MVDYSKWHKVEDANEGNNIQSEEETQIFRIQWHGKMTMADHQFYTAEATGSMDDYEKAIGR